MVEVLERARLTYCIPVGGFGKSRSLVCWMKLPKIPFRAIGFDLPTSPLCSSNQPASMRRTVQGHKQAMSSVTEQMMWLHSHAITTIKSSNATQNIVRLMLKLPSYTEPLKVLCLSENVEIVLRIHSGKNAAVDENLNLVRSGRKL